MSRQPGIPIGFSATPSTWNKLSIVISTPTKKMTEVHWLSVQTPIGYGDANYNAVVAVVNARAALMADNCNVVNWTLSQENVWRDAIGPNAPIPNPQGMGESENLGNDSLNIYYTAGPQYRRTAYMGAIPDSSVTGDLWVPGAANPFYPALVNYLNLLAAYSADNPPNVNPLPTQSLFGFLAVDMSNTCPVVNILSYAIVAGQSTFNVVCDAAPGVISGSVVRISRAGATSSSYPVDQLWTVKAVAGGTTLTLQSYPFAFNSTPLVPQGGKLQNKNRIFVPYVNWSVSGPGKRNRGVRTDSVLGRRKRKYNIGYPG